MRSVTLVTQGPIIFKQPVFLILIANVFALFSKKKPVIKQASNSKKNN
jgi:hypothetical protein